MCSKAYLVRVRGRVRVRVGVRVGVRARARARARVGVRVRVRVRQVGRLARARGKLLAVGRVVVRALSLLVAHGLSLGSDGRIDRRHCHSRRRDRRVGNGHRRFRLCRGGLWRRVRRCVRWRLL